MPRSEASTKEIDERISWVLEHPTMSGWLKDALNSALDRNPIDVLNDLEILNHLSAPVLVCCFVRPLGRQAKKMAI